MASLFTAGDQLRRAMSALEECRPNGRDYYPQGEGAFAEACAQYNSRWKRLQAVYDELVEVAIGIQDQGVS